MDTIEGSLLTCGEQSTEASSEDNAGQNIDIGKLNTETLNKRPWPLESPCECGIEPTGSISHKVRNT